VPGRNHYALLLCETLNTEQANYNGYFPYGQGAKGVYRQRTTAVGNFPPNAWGLYDMHGNVWEWTSFEEGSSRVFRGGGWSYGAEVCAASSRRGFEPVGRDGSVGFRLLAVLSERR
jgi:formylglycine-generating enzyme required for sulfatase activity